MTYQKTSQKVSKENLSKLKFLEVPYSVIFPFFNQYFHYIA